MKEFVARNMYCIYLDQFAVSGMFESEDKVWNEIGDLLLTGYKFNKIICPISVEHLWESSQKHADKAKLLDNAFLQISGGYSFKEETQITSQLLISNVRNNNITPKTYLLTNISSSILFKPGNFRAINAMTSQFEEELQDELKIMNLLREGAREQGWGQDIKNEMYKALMQRFVDGFIQKLELTIKKKPCADSIVNRLVSIHKMKGPETISLISHLRKHGFSQIPTLNIKYSLISYIYAQLKKESLSDQVDIARIATGLPVSDILLTDSKRKAEIIHLGLDKQYKSTVYCGTPEDKVAFLENLKQIIN